MAELVIPSAQQLIDGEWAAARDAGELDIADPATGQTIQTVACAGRADVDDAVAAARRAFPGWAATSASERGRLLRRWSELIGEHVEDLARFEARDVGKPLSGGRMNIFIAQGIIEYFAGAADKLTGVTLPTRTPDYLGYTLQEPYGVCAVIIPWNVPAVLTRTDVAIRLSDECMVLLWPHR